MNSGDPNGKVPTSDGQQSLTGHDPGSGLQRLHGLFQRPLPFLLAVLAPAAVAWWALYLLGQELGQDQLSAKAGASGVAFIAWPVLMLHWTGRPLELGQLDRNFAWGLLLYGAITAVLLSFYPGNHDFFRELAGSPRWSYLLKVAPVVMAVDLLTKRFIQREVARAHGDDVGEMAQAIVWFCGHAPELIWLQPLLGFWGTMLFMAGTGLATGRLYRRSGNVAGMMVGHWMVSLIVVMVLDSGL